MKKIVISFFADEFTLLSSLEVNNFDAALAIVNAVVKSNSKVKSFNVNLYEEN